MILDNRQWGSHSIKEVLQAIQAHVRERESLGCPAVQTLCFNRNPPDCDELDWLKRRVANLEVREQDPLCHEFTPWAFER